MSTAEHKNITKFGTEGLEELVELQRSMFRAEGEVTYATRTVSYTHLTLPTNSLV